MLIVRLFLLAVLMFCTLTVPAFSAVSKNTLNVRIDIEKSLLSGTSRIDVRAGEEVTLRKGALDIKKVKLDNKPLIFREHDDKIVLLPEEDGVAEISYAGMFRSDSRKRDTGIAGSVIDSRGVSLTGTWYPEMEGLSYYNLTVTLPAGYEALSEAEEITKEVKDGGVEFNFNFPHPVDGINLVASDRFTIVKDSYRDIEIYAYFFKEDLGLSKTYIEYTKKYLELYERLIGTYPYKRFSIVENFLPTGYSMPTYTLLGSTVVRLPFIVETSLGHEVLHQWFGNMVYIDYETGNWAEGLTTYLADHLYKEQKGEGPQYRKQQLVDYMSYVTVEDEMPLKFFKSRIDSATRSIGYGKTAMVFHMLMNLADKELFYTALKDLIQQNSFRRASWEDIRGSFEKIYQKDLSWFFDQWAEREGLPGLSLGDAEISQTGTKYNVHFHVDHTESVYKLNLPVTFYLKDTIKFDTLAIESGENSFDFKLDEKPWKIVLDEDYDIARYLHADELPPVIARLLGDEKIIVALPASAGDRYGSIIDFFKQKGAGVFVVEEIKVSDISSSSVVILGDDNPLIGKLFGKVPSDNAGFRALLKRNPWNERKVVGIFNGKSKKEVDAAFRKLRHYGKYSKLLFANGKNTEKVLGESQGGIVMDLKHEAAAVEISSVKTLSDVIKAVADKKIIYVGEQHDDFSHHSVQLDVISGLYKNNPKIAIGMEMFQRPFQDILDRFVSGSIDEAEFLKESEYFKRWRFNYNLYKPILDFARAEKVSVIALNVQREIIDKVSEGGMDSLSDEEKKAIPAELDFSDEEYAERLREIFREHPHSEEKSFNNFHQSQILWDETMSLSIDEFLHKNPKYQIIVIAGQGHLRYGSGIPKRTFRRNGFEYATILNDEEVEEGIADYVIFPKPVEGKKSPKLMVFLTEEEDRLKVAGFADGSVSEKAGIQKGDVILLIDGKEMKSVAEVRLFLFYKETGDVIKVRVLRKEDDEKEEEVDIEVTL